MRSETPAEWARVEQLLDEALELAAAEQEAFLERACHDQPALAGRVRELLRAAAAAGTFLEQPASACAPGLVRDLAEEGAATSAALPFDRLGPYRLIHELGRGGMGTVYLAERDDDEFRRQVAVKLVQAPVPDLTRRFRAERQILASLDHPNVARLYDGGTAPNGVPYLIMEYIAGQRIDVWCDTRRLAVEERLHLFDTVCAAVEFAHQNLVVHRDLKPSNVLVADDGAVKLLDFGVAKLLEVGALDPALPTDTGLRACTPEYASPEMLRGQPVSTAADVYALGVVLYELLSGRRPYELAGRSPLAAERILVEQEPAPPSTAATAEAAAHRGASLDRLRRRLAGDLDNIVLTALRKEPDRRYSSVHHLRDDVRRHLAGLPVTARPATWSYRAGKFVNRHRAGVAAGALVILSLGGGLAGTTWQSRTAARQAARAEREARRAERVRDFVVMLFESSDPDSTVGRMVTAKELLDRGAARLDADAALVEEPELRAEMLGVVGRIYRELGLYPQARPLLEQALAGRRGDGSPEQIAESAGELAAVLFEQGEFAAAESLAREAVEIRRGALDVPPELLAASLGELASVLSTQGQAEEADSLFREALAIERRLGEKRGLAARLNAYAAGLQRAARYEEALRAAEEALDIRRELYGAEHTDVATALLNVSVIRMELGDFAGAEQLLRECIAMREKLLGPEHPYVAWAFRELGIILERAGRLEDAEAAHRHALGIQRAAFGEDHPTVAGTMNSIGVVLYFRGRYAQAADMFAQVLPRWRAAYGPHHANVFAVLNNLGSALRDAGDEAAAERVLRETLSLRREALGNEHPDVAQSLNNLAILLGRRGTFAEAEMAHRDAIAIWRRSLGDAHPTLAYGFVSLGRLLVDLGRYAEAEAPLREGLAIRAAALDPQAPLLASSRLYMAEALIGLDRLAEGDSLLEAALPVLRAQWGEEGEPTRRARRALERLRAARSSGPPGYALAVPNAAAQTGRT